MDALAVEKKEGIDQPPEPATEPSSDAAAGAALGEEGAAAPAAAPTAIEPADASAELPAAAAQRTLQHSLEAIKLGSQRLAAMTKAAAVAVKTKAAAVAAAAQAPKAAPSEGGAADEAAPGASEDGAPTAPAVTTMARLAELGVIARLTSSRLVQSASEGIKRLAVGDPLLALCKSEPHVPQLVLAACTALTAGGGAAAEGIFKEDAPSDEVDALSARLAVGGRTRLIPAGTSPHAVATLLKRFLLGLQAPLMTYHLLPDFIVAAGDVSQVDAVVKKLPPANANTLGLLLEVCHAVAANSAATEMDALALAQVLAPCLAWLPPALAKSGAGAAAKAAEAAAAAPADEASRIIPLEGDEAAAIVVVVEALINRFPEIYG